MSKSFADRTVDWREAADGRPCVVLIDQTRLPGEYSRVELRDYRDVARAITSMVVRGAPAIGAAAALGVALAVCERTDSDRAAFLRRIEEASETLSRTRPTAVNLFWAIERMNRAVQSAAFAEPFDISRVRAAARAEALAVLDDDEKSNRAIGAFGSDFIADGARVLTHCNAGALACVAYGTALGVIRAAVELGKRVVVFAGETRPRLQGMNLTAWELARDGIDVTVICDSSAGYLMSRGDIDCVIVGADRIAVNGDTANKIGTFSMAVLARAHGIPFYVAAPLSTVDFSIPWGEKIPIEQRDADEMIRVGDARIGPEGVKVLNYAFDVTPARFITAIITDRGVANPDYRVSLPGLRDAPTP